MTEKKLFKSRDKKIAGVCGGFAEYLNMDPTLVRVIWAAFSLLAGAGVLLYFVCAVVMPQPEN